jgi:hypothetical protein
MIVTIQKRLRVAFGIAVVLASVVYWLGESPAAEPARRAAGKDTNKVASPEEASKPPKESKGQMGLALHDPKAFQGYTLMAPMMSTKTYLIDMQGRVVRTWESDCTPALSAYLLPNGHLLRPGVLRGEQQFGGGPGAGGRIQEFTWDGELVWDYKFSSDKQLPHHDITKLPNGNVLMVVWDKKTADEAIAAGRAPDAVGDRPLMPDAVVEIEPTGKTTGKIVWQWHLWDHLIQDRDRSKANYGNVAAHPELVDINNGEGMAPVLANKDEVAKLRSIGYLGDSTGGRPRRIDPDWTHVNSVAYNAEFDQILLSVHGFSEIWIIDHGTTSAEAAGHAGGRRSKGGDLLYRWGNPRTYRAGTVADQQLFAQHDASWIPHGATGEGHVLVFNNRRRGPEGNHSSVDEIVLPVDAQGNYAWNGAGAFGPEKAYWSYTAPKKSDFYSGHLAGAQRLPNGDTLICSGESGVLFEVTAEQKLVWKYTNPIKGGPGSPPMGGAWGGFGGPGGIGGRFRPGQIMPPPLQDMLKLTSEQSRQLDELQKEADAKLARVLTDQQKKRLEEMRNSFGRGGPLGGFGPQGEGSVFRTYRYAPDYSGLAGRDLTPGKSLEELQSKHPGQARPDAQD